MCVSEWNTFFIRKISNKIFICTNRISIGNHLFTKIFKFKIRKCANVFHHRNMKCLLTESNFVYFFKQMLSGEFVNAPINLTGIDILTVLDVCLNGN